jgi:chemotaxis protein CheX
MDSAVADIFETMLAQPCASVQESPAFCPTLSARVTISGSIEAQCFVEFPVASAEKLAAAFLGPSDGPAWDEATVGDALGELCNMIAGGFKKRLGEPAASSDLSVPAIARIAESDNGSGSDAPETEELRRTYAFDSDDERFRVRLAAL